MTRLASVIVAAILAALGLSAFLIAQSDPPGDPAETTPPGSQGSSGNDAAAATAALQADLEATRAALDAAMTEHDAALATAQAASTEAETRVVAATAAADAATQRALEAHRRAVLAEHRGTVIDELVAGSTPEEIDASVEVAKSAYSRAVESARAQLAQTQVPAGASTHTEAEETESLSPLERISRGIRGNGRA